MFRRARGYGALLAGCLLLAVACASGPAPESEQPASPPAASGGEAAPAQAAPSWARMPSKPPGDPKRVCLWVFWTNDPQVLQKLQALLSQGRPFQSASLDIVRANHDFATTQADCLARKDLPPAMGRAVGGLQLGQVSDPFELNQGTALAMLTTDVFRRQARELYQKGKYSQAMQPLGLDLELHPADAGSWHLMALCRAAVGNDKGALQAYERALEWTPNDPAVLNDKAALLNTMGDSGQAVVLFRRALELSPQNPVYMNNLAWALARNTQELDEAMSLAQKAARLAPDNPAVWDTLGTVQQAKGEHAAAVVSFYRALSLDPEAKGAKGRMADSLLQLSPEQLSRLSRDAVAPAPSLASAPAAQSGPAAPSPASGWSTRPAPEPELPVKEEPLPALLPPSAAALAPKPEPQPAPAPPAQPAPAPQVATAPAPPAGEEGRPPQGWYLQQSSNRNPNLARQARDGWRAAGQAAQVWDWRSPKSGLWHRVLIGPFAGKQEALAAGRRLKAAGKLPAYVLVRVR